MKHSDFYTIYKNIERLEEQELIKAVQAHKDVYEFVKPDEDGDYPKDYERCPIVSAAAGYDDQYYDYLVVSVEVRYSEKTKNPYFYVYGIEKECGAEVGEIKVATGHLHYIIDEIPATKDVSDVSSPIDGEMILKNVKNN